MPKQTKTDRPLWSDRFASPTPNQLFAQLEPDAAELATTVRETLTSGDRAESLRWCGLPWRWAFSYRGPDGEEIAYLVPNPEGPAVVFRLSHEQFDELPKRKLSRYVRDGLAQARLVAGVAWPEWSFQSQNQVKDLLQLFDMLSEQALTNA